MKAGSRPLGGAPLLGMVFAGESASAAAWSGIPPGLTRGLEALGARVAHVRAEPAPALTVAATWAIGLPARRLGRGVFGPEVAALRTIAVRRRLERARERPAALIQVGTEFELPADGPPSVTFQDMTLALARRMPDPTYERLSELEVRTWTERERRAYARAHALCVMSRWTADSLERDYGIDPERIHVVGCGRNHEPRPAERDWGSPRFLFVGKAWERKNGPAVLRAFAALRAELPAARLDVVGEHPPIAQPGVTAHGPLRLGVPEEAVRVERLFAEATCFVMPSRYEPFGIVYSEAGAAGVPSIGTTVGGAADPVGPGGRLVDPLDDRALLDAMRELARPEVARELGERARRHAGGFTWERVAERVLAALPAV